MGGGGGGREGGDGAETSATTASTTTATAASKNAEMADDIAFGTDQKPALHVIVLGSGGGPLESNVTAFLVRSLSTGWSKGSVVAVDAGVHLSAISKILEKTQPARLGHCEDFPLPYTLTDGPFKDLTVPNATHTANAAHIHRSLIDTYLITHPHLDHISGFVVNTAGLPGSRPKRLAGLPSTIAAFKAHIFNNVIWPNLSDENNGAGLVTYMRLVEGGSPALGEGEGRGYLEICDGLAVKIWGVSHGHCIERHSHRGSGSVRHGSFDASSMGPIGVGMGLSSNPTVMSPRALAHHNSAGSNFSSFMQQQQQQQQRELDRMQGGSGSQAGTAALGSRKTSVAGGESVCVYDSSAYFIRDVSTGREILIFGDVEPDSISLSPRNQLIWQEAAPKIANGKLAAIFIECSYDDSQPDDRLYGHLTPKYIAEEMSVLAEEVKAARSRSAIHSESNGTAAMERSHSSGYASDKKKRKRESLDDQGLLLRRKSATPTPHAGLNNAPSRTSSATYPGHLTPRTSYHSEDAVSPKTARPSVHIPPTRSGLAPNTSNSHHAPSSVSNDSARNSIDSTAWSASGGAMASVMRRQRSGSGSGSYFDSPHLATPTASLSLQDVGDSKTSSLPPPIMQAGACRHEPQPITQPGLSGHMLVPAVDGLHDDHDPHHYHGSYAVGPLEHAPHPSVDYDVPMRMVPEEEEYDEKSTTPRQGNGNGNGNGNHHHGHPFLRHAPRHGYEDAKVKYEDERVKVEDLDEGKDVHQYGMNPAHSEEMPLRGLKVVIIHVKDKLNDGRKAEEVILEELLEHESQLQLGCEYMVSESGQDLYL